MAVQKHSRNRMGAPNANYYQGTIEYTANLKWKGIIPMAELLEQKFKIH